MAIVRILISCFAMISLGTMLLAACGGGGTAPTSAPADEATAAPTSTPAATQAPLPTSETVAEPTAAPTSVPTLAPTEAPTSVPPPTPVATEAELFLQLVEPTETEVITEESSITVTGRTRADAVVTINDTAAEPDSEGLFASLVELEDGPNIIELISSLASGEQVDLVLVVIYIP